MTIRKTRDTYIRRRRVPLAEFYSSIYENFRVVYTNETGESNVEVAPACGGVEVGGIAILPAPCSSESWLSFKRNGRSVVIPDVRFGNNIHALAQRSGS